MLLNESKKQLNNYESPNILGKAFFGELFG